MKTAASGNLRSWIGEGEGDSAAALGPCGSAAPELPAPSGAACNPNADYTSGSKLLLVAPGCCVAAPAAAPAVARTAAVRQVSNGAEGHWCSNALHKAISA